MLAFLGLMTASAGVFLFLWYRTIVSLPVKKQPSFIHRPLFKWGIPAVSLAVGVSGLYELVMVNLWLAGLALAAGVLLSVLIVKTDRYSAEMRIIHGYYMKLREANPGMEEMEILYLVAKWRYPQWSHDRIVELVAGKDLGNLILLMMITENKISPISDWELYRSLKARAARIVGEAGGGES
ncbi:MAG TPA: hypothetical protein VE398_10810 [Acidobacteriota bacterium]|nr:hypothetical protein [Acidobacteriota bacterium]